MDVIQAFNHAADRIRQQIKHYKEKIQDHRRNPSHNGGDVLI
jgi:putative sigma-54 modulation protein